MAWRCLPTNGGRATHCVAGLPGDRALPTTCPSLPAFGRPSALLWRAATLAWYTRACGSPRPSAGPPCGSAPGEVRGTFGGVRGPAQPPKSERKRGALPQAQSSSSPPSDEEYLTQLFLAWGKAWRLKFSKAEFAVYEQLGYNAKFETCEVKARVQYDNGHYDQTRDRFLRKRAGGGHLRSPKKNRRQR